MFEISTLFIMPDSSEYSTVAPPPWNTQHTFDKLSVCFLVDLYKISGFIKDGLL